MPIVVSGWTDFDGRMSYQMKLDGLVEKVPEKARQFLSDLDLDLSTLTSVSLRGNVDHVDLSFQRSGVQRRGPAAESFFTREERERIKVLGGSVCAIKSCDDISLGDEVRGYFQKVKYAVRVFFSSPRFAETRVAMTRQVGSKMLPCAYEPTRQDLRRTHPRCPTDRGDRGALDRWSDRVLAQLGRAIEPLLEGSRALALRRAGAAVPLSECLASVDSAAGRRRVVEYLESGPFPALSAGSRLAGAGGPHRCRWHANPGAIRRPGIPGGPMPLMEFAEFDRRPILVAIAGPNGAGKTTFFHAHLASAGLRFVNADVLAAELAVEPYEAARLADALRQALVGRGRVSSLRRCSPIRWATRSRFWRSR